MGFKVPADWVFQSSANNGNSVTYALPGHTTQQPKIAVFSRVIPSYSAKTGWSVPSYRVRVIEGVVDADGNPIETRTTVDATFRCSMSGGATKAQDVVDNFKLIVSANGFASGVFVEQSFPTPAAP